MWNPAPVTMHTTSEFLIVGLGLLRVCKTENYTIKDENRRPGFCFVCLFCLFRFSLVCLQNGSRGCSDVTVCEWVMQCFCPREIPSPQLVTWLTELVYVSKPGKMPNGDEHDECFECWLLNDIWFFSRIIRIFNVSWYFQLVGVLNSK